MVWKRIHGHDGYNYFYYISSLRKLNTYCMLNFKAVTNLNSVD